MKIRKAKPAPIDEIRALGEDIHYAFGESSLGTILVADSAKGIVAILIGDNRDELLLDLEQRFPNAGLMRGHRETKLLAAKIVAFAESPAEEPDITLDIRGTPFRKRVLEMVRKIPVGETSTYSKIARQVGAPRAMRAVGSTCTNNNLELVIPCHRVLRSDGSLAGGRYQRILLDREAAAISRKHSGD